LSKPDREAMLDRAHPELSVRRQCTLLGLARSGVYRVGKAANDNDLAVMRRLDDVQPFWLDPGDPHRMRAAIQFLTQPRAYAYPVIFGTWRHSLVQAEGVWPEAVHRVAADGLGPEQAVDEAIARIKQILTE